ncbi:MAG TPA: hypothetical protein PLT36_01645 [Erysipelotrichaceae bacterium]|jgi:hypothetical protein|nr:hypothetical protein [Erysipelotrichia bacterium]HPX32194.1 hypothetical protein [Erysipelotrichaceae bacterium]HQA84998.1 hypothetical protein [Erysipelotrichaceae bacterium]
MEKKVTFKKRFETFIDCLVLFVLINSIYYAYTNRPIEQFEYVLESLVSSFRIFTIMSFLFLLGNYFLNRKEYNQNIKKWLTKRIIIKKQDQEVDK